MVGRLSPGTLSANLQTVGKEEGENKMHLLNLLALVFCQAVRLITEAACKMAPATYSNVNQSGGGPGASGTLLRHPEEARSNPVTLLLYWALVGDRPFASEECLWVGVDPLKYADLYWQPFHSSTR